jgi:hypothetical protein
MIGPNDARHQACIKYQHNMYLVVHSAGFRPEFGGTREKGTRRTLDED